MSDVDGVPTDDSSNVVSRVIEVPMKGTDEVVTVDLINELPDDYTDLTTFLENESAASKFWIAIAAAYSNKGLTKEAFEISQEGLLKYPQGKDAAIFHSFLAWLYLREAKSSDSSSTKNELLKKASDATRTALNLDGKNVLNRLAQAEIFYQQKNYDQALDIYERIIKQVTSQQTEVFALLGKAKVLFKRRNYSASLKQFQAVLLLNPSIKPDPRIGIGLNFWRLKDHNLAVKSWERSLELDSNNQVAKLLLVLSKFDSSFKSLTDEDFVDNYSKALDSLQSFISHHDENPVSLLLLTSYYYSQNKLDLVLKLAEKVLKFSNASSNVVSDAQFWIARVHYEREDYIQAHKFFNESLKSNSDNLLSKLGVGQSLYQRTQVEESILVFENIYKVTQKVLEVDYILGILYSFDSKNHPKTIQVLEKYIRLAKDKNEPLILNAYSTLSRLYENKDNSQALSYLSQAIELLTSLGEEVPVEILNNLGVFHFIKGNPESAKTFFNSAVESNKSEDLEITLKYNVARVEENTDLQSSISSYNSILDRVPNYIYSKIRLLYLDIIKPDIKTNASIEENITNLLKRYPTNLEVRAFYSWFLKRSNKSTNQSIESAHNKETLVKYDSHDTYALISLGNLYCSIAREIKGKSNQDIEKRNQSYVRGAQLFQKVLSLDPNNVFAAQGIAIIFVENKQPSTALEIFRKIRDAIDDVSVYINLGHSLIEVGQFAKAIESYEIALRRYGDETKDSKYLTLVARAWFARAVSEKSLESFLKSLEYSMKSYEVGVENEYKRLLPSLQYNVAFVKFNIAQFVQRLDVSKRTVDDIKKAIEGLQTAIESFNALSEEKYPPIQPEILKQRASMGSNTLINQLERGLKEQEEYEVRYQSKIEEARRLREVEKAKAELEEQKRKEEEERISQEKKIEYLKLQEQAREWEKERENAAILDDDLPGEESGKKSRKGKKKNAILTDEELSEDEEDRVKVKKNGKKKNGGKKLKRKKDVETEQEVEVKKRKVNDKFKSSEFVEDSDESMDDFDESKLEEDDALEKAEAQLENEESNQVEKDDDEEEEDDGLF